jgi:hypothetical protein
VRHCGGGKLGHPSSLHGVPTRAPRRRDGHRLVKALRAASGSREGRGGKGAGAGQRVRSRRRWEASAGVVSRGEGDGNAAARHAREQQAASIESVHRPFLGRP